MKITRLNISFLMVVVSACVACATQVQDLFPPAKNAPTRSIYLVNQGWHAGIIPIGSRPRFSATLASMTTAADAPSDS